MSQNYVKGLYYRIFVQNYISQEGSYYGIILGHYITGLYYKIILWNYITGWNYRIIYWDRITGLYYGIILRDSATELYYQIILRIHIREWCHGTIYHGIIFMKRIPGMPWTSPGLGSQGSPGHAPGTPGDTPGPPGHAPGTPRDTPRTTGNPHGPQKRP